MQVIDQPIKLDLIKNMAKNSFGKLIKAVVDTEIEVMAIDADMHADEEAKLLENGSQQKDLWGINIYPEKYEGSDFIEFDSMINLRPTQNNLSRGVEDEKIKEKIKLIVKKLIRP
ncbi:MAG: DUF5674 family protein [Candidatus Beckwithbacteria bacterium]